jgi:hypothetical protein
MTARNTVKLQQEQPNELKQSVFILAKKEQTNIRVNPCSSVAKKFLICG